MDCYSIRVVVLLACLSAHGETAHVYSDGSALPAFEKKFIRRLPGFCPAVIVSLLLATLDVEVRTVSLLHLQWTCKVNDYTRGGIG